MIKRTILAMTLALVICSVAQARDANQVEKLTAYCINNVTNFSAKTSIGLDTYFSVVKNSVFTWNVRGQAKPSQAQLNEYTTTGHAIYKQWFLDIDVDKEFDETDAWLLMKAFGMVLKANNPALNAPTKVQVKEQFKALKKAM